MQKKSLARRCEGFEFFPLKVFEQIWGKEYTETSNRIASQVPGLKINIEIKDSGLNEALNYAARSGQRRCCQLLRPRARF